MNNLKVTSKRKQKEYDKFMNEQFEILKGHFERCMLRCHNKMMELDNKPMTQNNTKANGGIKW